MNGGAVFLIDDEATVRGTFEAMLAVDGHSFSTAASGQEALAKLPESVPDVILLDVMMPAMDGYEVCRRIKADARLRHVPVILVTVLDTKDDLVKGLDAGADEFLSKPVGAVELRARVRSMMRIKRQHDRLRAMVRMRDDLASMLVHDMRAPLNVVLLHTSSLSRAESPEPAEVRRHAEAIAGQTERANAFLNDMLTLAKLEAGKLVPSRAAVDLNPLLRSVESDHREVAESRTVALRFDLPDRSRAFMLDPTLIRRVLDNLLSNAIKFSPPGGEVRVVAAYGGGSTAAIPALRIEVQDHGPGIPDGDKERVFDKFEVVGQRRRGVAQLGLGLSFARLAVEAHGGRLSVRDNTPAGSIFVLEIEKPGGSPESGNSSHPITVPPSR
jgi:two-component system sensor histidine kinase/response regulator